VRARIFMLMQKESYYERHKQNRRDYQKQYYENNKDRIRRKRMMEELDDPIKFEKRKAYQREYYLTNKEKILKKRAETYVKKRTSAKSNSKSSL
jgi:hypothetical protein